MNLDFIKKVLMSYEEYWIVAKKTFYRKNFEIKRGEDQIIFLSISKNIRRGLEYNEITLKDIESFEMTHVDANIFMNSEYPPFQLGISFSDVYDGFPIKKNIREFLIKFSDLKSNDLCDYKKIYEKEYHENKVL